MADPHRHSGPLPPLESADEAPDAGVVIRDLVIFHVKLWLDGLKDVVLAPLSVGAVVIDLALKRRGERSLFYRVLRAGERYDLWLNLYGAATQATHRRSGLLESRDALPPGGTEPRGRPGDEGEHALPAPPAGADPARRRSVP